ncbi:Uncharacterised protein [Klebsiella pneumoniae]|nr:hypothetical protein [Erwinia aphidicola]VTT27405.1 Uncharacterised protein [Klebsiella pneumoniae]
MFTFYYINKLPQQNGLYGVHVKGCRHLPPVQQREFLGSFFSASDALRVARLRFGPVTRCQSCLHPQGTPPARRQRQQAGKAQPGSGKHCGQ